MTIRATVEFKPDQHGPIDDAVTEWQTAEAARRWGEAMERLTPGARLMDLEDWCPECQRWEDLTPCVYCDRPLCDEEAAAACEQFDETCCVECAAVHHPSDDECRAPGPAELGACLCGAHR